MNEKIQIMKVRKIEKGDLETRIKWMNDPRIFQHMGFTPPITYENTLKWFEKNQNKDNRIDLTYLDDNNNIIGFGGITEIDWKLRNGEIYIFINPDLHGKGLGSKTFNLLLEIGFRKLKLNKLNSHIDASNIGSRKAHEKGGFKLEGILRDEKMLDGKYEDRCYYGVLNKEYNPNNIIIDDILIEDYPLKIVRDDVYPQTGGGG